MIARTSLEILVCGLLITLLPGCSSKPESTFDEVKQCRSPNRLRPTKTIKRWKYDRVWDTVMLVVTANQEGITFPLLVEKVTAEFSKQDQMLIGNMLWYIETTVLEMETAGELTRFPDTETALPQNIRI